MPNALLLSGAIVGLIVFGIIGFAGCLLTIAFPFIVMEEDEIKLLVFWPAVALMTWIAMAAVIFIGQNFPV